MEILNANRSSELRIMHVSHALVWNDISTPAPSCPDSPLPPLILIPFRDPFRVTYRYRYRRAKRRGEAIHVHFEQILHARHS